MSDNDNILAGADMWNVYEVARAVNAVNVKVEALKRMVDRHVHWDHGEESLREKMLALCEKWECVAETPSDPADVHGNEDRDRTRVLEDEYRWRGDYLRQMWADFAEAVCYMSIGPATPEALAWGRKKVDELGLGESGQAADGEEPQPEMSPVFAGQLHDLAQLRALAAENAVLRAKVSAHEKEMIDYIDAVGELERRRFAKLRAERDAAQARVAELEAALREAVRIITAGDVVERSAFVRYVPYVTGSEVDALRAALGEEASDAE